MVCFYHPDRPALGICSHCHRGLCENCLTVVDDVLACKDRHEIEVKSLIQTRLRLALQTGRIGSGYVRNAVFYGLVGVAFSAFGLFQYRFLGLQGLLFVVLGAFLLYAAGANFLESRRFH
jgi:sulfite exporter TauE/SafE